MKNYHKAFIRMAYIWAEESYCKRRQVGSMIAKDSRPISGGYNGTPSGEDNCCEEDFGSLSDIETAFLDIDIKNKELLNMDSISKDFCKENGLTLVSFEKKSNKIIVKYRRPSIRTKDSVIHAEANAIAYAAKEGISTKGCTMYVTLSPCMNCSNLIIQSGITTVVYSEDYRDSRGIEHLKSNGINVLKIEI